VKAVEGDAMARLCGDGEVVQRILDHIDNRTTDLGEACWREPVQSYVSDERFAAELHLVLRRCPTPFCPSAALPEAGSYVAREAAGTPILAVRGDDGRVRAFRNACRHRGTMLAEGAGCEKAFVCRYHGWTYGLDGALRHVPHEYGFPGLDKSARGLVPVDASESNGLVIVTQDPPGITETPGAIPELFSPRHRLLACSEEEVITNWKIVAEGFLEGYHIRSTHRETFYPIQYDNLNVVERFGRNSRIAFPYRRIEKLRALPPEQRSAEGMLTYVYHFFPNVVVATFPYSILMAVLEPLAVDRTRILTYALTDRTGGADGDQERMQRSRDFLLAGTVEDRAVARSVQRGLGSGANEFFEFGRFEGAIGHFHRSLHALIDDADGLHAEQARASRG
jgi:phenylpropionate dioxygenase-like ring-hydroxylating dioxygenase large terminal subunit